MTRESDEAWRPSEHEPFAADEHAAQIAALPTILGPPPRRVLDLGCGTGRVLIPLARLGYAMLGIDRDAAAIEACRAGLAAAAADATLASGDITSAWPVAPATLDAVLCLGNTFCTVSDVDTAVVVLERARTALVPEGVVVLDDTPAECWPELTEGNWTSGISESGDAQIVWHPSDAVFALRSGDAVDSSSWSLGPRERALRLWTDGALRLAARAAGLSAPSRVHGAHLVVMRHPGKTTGRRD